MLRLDRVRLLWHDDPSFAVSERDVRQGEYMEAQCMHATNYPSDMNDTEWELIRPYVDVREHLGAPRSVCLRCVI